MSGRGRNERKDDGATDNERADGADTGRERKVGKGIGALVTGRAGQIQGRGGSAGDESARRPLPRYPPPRSCNSMRAQAGDSIDLANGPDLSSGCPYFP